MSALHQFVGTGEWIADMDGPRESSSSTTRTAAAFVVSSSFDRQGTGGRGRSGSGGAEEATRRRCVAGWRRDQGPVGWSVGDRFGAHVGIPYLSPLASRGNNSPTFAPLARSLARVATWAGPCVSHFLFPIYFFCFFCCFFLVFYFSFLFSLI